MLMQIYCFDVNANLFYVLSPLPLSHTKFLQKFQGKNMYCLLLNFD